MAIDTARRRPRIFHGWYIVGFAFVAQMVAGPYVFGVFVKPMTEELGWSRGDYSLTNTFAMGVSGVLGFFIGPMVDKKYGRWLVTGGAVIAGLSLISLAFVQEIWQFWVLRGVLYTIGSAGMSPLVVNSTLSKWFVRQRGRAVSTASMGLSAGAIFVAPAAGYIVAQFDWRTAWVMQGLLLLVVLVVPAIVIIRRQPEDVGLLPDGDVEPPAGAPAPITPVRSFSTEEHWTRSEALHTRQLWALIAIFGVGNIPTSAIVLHLIPFFQDVGFSVAFALALVTFENFFALISKPFWGYYLDRLDPRALVALGWGIKLPALFLLPLIGDDYGIVLVMALLALYGTGVGSGQTGQEVIWAYYFGRRHIGSVRSLALPFTIIFGAGGTWFAGWAWDQTGSYTFSFMLFGALSALSMISIMMIRPPQRPARLTEPSTSVATTGS